MIWSINSTQVSYHAVPLEINNYTSDFHFRTQKWLGCTTIRRLLSLGVTPDLSFETDRVGSLWAYMKWSFGAVTGYERRNDLRQAYFRLGKAFVECPSAVASGWFVFSLSKLGRFATIGVLVGVPPGCCCDWGACPINMGCGWRT